MTSHETYPLSLGLSACHMLGIDPLDMLNQAGLGHLELKQAANGVSAQDYIAAWTAMIDLTGRESMPIDLGIAIARGPVVPVFLALDCAPDLERGLRRITRYKRLIGPSRMHVFGDADNLTVEYESTEPWLELPSSMMALYLSFVAEKARLMTARSMIPVAATLKSEDKNRHALARQLGVLPMYGEKASLTYSRADATSPFLSSAQGLWEAMEQDLERQLTASVRASSMSSKVTSALLTQMPLGNADVVSICDDLGVSRSTMQRRLSDEQTTFQQILDDTREQLAVRYLTKSAFSNDEISYLLAYSDPNSFFRSFRRWTGLSPSEVRAKAG
jgi:AraC-like DNA-binding protein